MTSKDEATDDERPAEETTSTSDKEPSGEQSNKKRKIAEKEEEPDDEWTTLASTYTASFVPAFQPIYHEISNELKDKKYILDFGCGPGEPCMTICEESENVTVVTVDSTPAMLEIAKKRLKEHTMKDRVVLEHIRRDISMTDLKKRVTDAALSIRDDEAGSGPTSFDAVVSSFTIHYTPFHRRVELLETFLDLAPNVYWITWGHPSKVSFLRAVKTFGKWKFQPADEKEDICNIIADEEDDDICSVESPPGSFTMHRQETVAAVIEKVNAKKKNRCTMKSFDRKNIPLVFESVEKLLSFLPFPKTDNDTEALTKLLKYWSDTTNESIVNPSNGELTFETEVIFCQIETVSETAKSTS